jgi:hypothetical protein
MATTLLIALCFVAAMAGDMPDEKATLPFFYECEIKWENP